MNVKNFFIFMLILSSCKQSKDVSNTIISNNEELKKIYALDQSDRSSNHKTPYLIYKRDSTRRVRVRQLIDSNKVRTGKDYFHAAVIFQHGNDSLDSSMAVKMMKKSIERDSTINKWLLAAAIDRDLMYKNKPQIYGTQFVTNGSVWELYEIDTTVISDLERVKYGVGTLNQQRLKVKELNKSIK